MKRLGRFLIDIIGSAIAAVGLILGALGLAIILKISSAYNSAAAAAATVVSTPSLKTVYAPEAKILGGINIAAIVLAAIAVILLIVAIFLILKKGPHIGFTIVIWLLALVIITLAVYGFIKANMLKDAWNGIVGPQTSLQI